MASLKEKISAGVLIAALGIGSYFVKELSEDFELSDRMDSIAEADDGANFSRKSISSIVDEDIERIGKDTVIDSAYLSIFEAYAGIISEVDEATHGDDRFYQYVDAYNEVNGLLDHVESQGLLETKLGIKIKREKRDLAYGAVSYIKSVIKNCYLHYDIMFDGNSCLDKTGDSEDEAMERVACLLEQKRNLQNYCRGQGIEDMSKIDPGFRDMYDRALVIALDNNMTL